MALHDLVLEPRQPIRLREDRVGDADLPDVVEEAREMQHVDLLRAEPELPAGWARGPPHALRVARGIRILRVDRRVQALDSLERTLLEQPVGFGEAQCPAAELLVLAAQRPRGRAHEQRKGRPESDEHAPDGKPEHGATRADQAVERSRVGVDLIGPDCACAVPVLDRRIDLEQLPVAEFVALERVLAVGAGSDECRDRLVLADRLAELVVERETMIDQMPIAIRREPAGARPGARVRPGEDAVPPPDLHRGDVALPQNAAGKLTVLLPGDVNAPVANE